MSARADLTPDGPLGRLDRAIALLRHGGMRPVLWAWASGALPALGVVLAYDLEALEGIHDLRLLLALLLVVAFAARSIGLSRVAAGYTRALGDVVTIEPGAGGPLAVARTSFVVATFLALWSLPLFLASLAGPTAVALVLPLLCLRGLSAPAWLARAGTTKQGGLGSFFAAVNDNTEQRGEGMVVELLVLLGALGLALDLTAALALLLLLLRAFLGIDVALLDGFLSARNTFALLLTGMGSLVLFEPLRAALSALAFVDARVRRDGLDVRAAVEAAIEHADGRRGRTRASGAAALAAAVLFGLASAGAARAQDVAAPVSEGAEASAPRDLDDDLAAQGRAAEILAGPAYRDFEDTRGRGIRDALERWLAEALRDAPVDSPTGGGLFGGAALPGPTVFVVVAVIGVLAVLAYLVVTRERREDQAVTPVRAERRDDPRDRAPTAWMDDAGALAESGRLREALRALYLATLVALDRQRVIAFDPALTNWQYLRQMGAGWRRSDFRELTRLFDHKWYGHEETRVSDYTTCRALSERLVSSTEKEPRA